MYKAIPDFPAYEVSTTGTIRRNGRVLRPWIEKNGYARVSLCKGGVASNHWVHRLVLLAHVGPCPVGAHACHNNGVSDDNRVVNLRWDTPSSNARDKYAHGYTMPTAGRLRVAAAHKGRKLSAAHRRKLSIAKLGNKNRLGGNAYLEGNR